MAWLENLVRDVRYSLRSLAASPGFTSIAVLSLGLGIGAGTAVFSLANAVLLRSLPVPKAEELRVLHWSATDVRMTSYDGGAETRPDNRWIAAESVSHPAFLSLRAHAASQADVFGFYPLRNTAVMVGEQAFVADGMLVSDNFLSGLQVRPLVGRLLQGNDDYAGGRTSVVIGFEWWERYFGRDPAVLGRTVTLNGTGHTVVGVLAPGFTGVQPGLPCSFYVPMAPASPFLYMPITSDWHWFVRLMARVRPGASDERLAATLGGALAAETTALMKSARFVVESGHAGLGYDRAQYRRPLLVMLAVVGLVLLAACANLAGLLLARGTARRHEMAVRAALGGGGWRLFQQALAESLTIALLGGALGVLLAMWARSALSRLLTGTAEGLLYDFSLDPAVLIFSLSLTLASAVLAGLLPSLRARRAQPIHALRSRGALATPRLRSGRALVAAQVGLALLVLSGAGLFVRTVVNLTRIEAGFGLERLLLVGLNIRGGNDADANPALFYERAQAAVSAIPGVQAAAIVEFPLLGPGGSTGTFQGFAGGSASAMSVRRLRVSESFFATVGIPILAGRSLQATDAADAPKVVVVNESFVHRYVPDRNPIGLAFKMWEAEWRIVGICGDAKYNDIREVTPPTAYYPYRQMFYSRFRATHLRGASIVARTAVAPLTVAADVRLAVAGVDQGVAITTMTTQEDVRDRAIARERLLASLCVGLAGLALFLSCVGLFGLMAYAVAQRTSEIGLRMALGATELDVAAPILREALLLTGAGIAVGLPLSLALAGLVRSQLFGVSPGDPISITIAATALFATAAAAAWLPARRARKVEPTEALRHDG